MHTQGTLTKIYIDGSKRKPQERYIHLLSDALIYSSKLIGPYKYKVRDGTGALHTFTWGHGLSRNAHRSPTPQNQCNPTQPHLLCQRSWPRSTPSRTSTRPSPWTATRRSSTSSAATTTPSGSCPPPTPSTLTCDLRRYRRILTCHTHAIATHQHTNSFQAPDEATAKSWMLAITQAATAYRAKLESGAQVC